MALAHKKKGPDRSGPFHFNQLRCAVTGVNPVTSIRSAEPPVGRQRSLFALLRRRFASASLRSVTAC